MQFGRYETLRLLATGGMGRVYLGRAVGPGGFERRVAIKAMHDHVAADPAFSAMFLDEARLAARIHHPNVVPTLDVAADGSFIVMEWVDGASLLELSAMLRRRDELLPLPVVLRIALDVLDGLEAAHALTADDGSLLGLVHRDVSPHNVLVGVDGVARLTDFGIAHASARLTTTREGQLKGKLPYMPPEQLENLDLDRRSDVYAAGCVLWEMLTGERLFRADSEAALVCAILAGPRQSPRDLRGDLPSALDACVMRALARREARFERAAELAEAIELAASAAAAPIARPRAVAAIAREARDEANARSSSPEPSRDLSGQTASVRGDTSAPVAVRPVRALDDSTALDSPRARADARGDDTGARTAAGDPQTGSLVASVYVPKNRGAGLAAVVVIALVALFVGSWLALRAGVSSDPSGTAVATLPASVAPPSSASAPLSATPAPTPSAAPSAGTSGAMTAPAVSSPTPAPRPPAPPAAWSPPPATTHTTATAGMYHPPAP